MITVDRREWDIEDIVRTEILPYMSAGSLGLIGGALAGIAAQRAAEGAAASQVAAQASISPLFDMTREVKRLDRKRQRIVDDEDF